MLSPQLGLSGSLKAALPALTREALSVPLSHKVFSPDPWVQPWNTMQRQVTTLFEFFSPTSFLLSQLMILHHFRLLAAQPASR